jgi:hypothetical protein
MPDPRYELFHPGFRVKKIPVPNQRSSVFLTPNKIILDVHPGFGFFSILDLDEGVKKTPDPGSAKLRVISFNI